MKKGLIVWYGERQQVGEIIKSVRIGDIDIEVRERLDL